MRKTIRDLLLLRPRGSQYLLRDEFSDALPAGSVNGTPATPGPGTRSVTDTTSVLSLSSGLAVFGGATDLWPDPLLVYAEGITRIAGRLIMCRVRPTIINEIWWGLALCPSTAFGANNTEAAFRFYIGGSLTARYQAVNTAIGTYSAATWYTLAIVLRATGEYLFVDGKLLWIDSRGNSATLYAGVTTYDNAPSVVEYARHEWLRIPAALWLPTPLAYDTFTRANGALGSSEGAGPDGQHALARTWTNIGGDFDINGNAVIAGDAQAEMITDGDMSVPGSWTIGGAWAIAAGVATYDDSGVSSIRQAVTVVQGRLYRTTFDIAAAAVSARQAYTNQADANVLPYDSYVNGSYDIVFAATNAGTELCIYGHTVGSAYTLDNVSLVECHADHIDADTADVVFQAELTTPAAGTDPAGLILRRDGATMWLVQVTPGTAGTDLELIEINDGAPTVRATADVDPAAATAYTVVAICDGQTIDVFFNNAREIHYTTAAVGETNTQFGIWDSDNANFTFDDVLLMPRGSNNEYADLDKWSED